MGHETPHEKPEPIDIEAHELPLQIKESEGFEHQGRDTALWQVLAADPRTPPQIKDRLIALKQVREMQTPEEMRVRKEFYEFLKSSPRFAKFVPNTLFFVARETAHDNPRMYAIQKMIAGRQIANITDTELAKNPELMKELVEFIDAAIEMFAEASKKKMPIPDYYGETSLANNFHNPRGTSNIIIADTPDANGQRVFFIDTGINNLQEETFVRKFLKPVTIMLQIHHLKNWRKALLKQLESKS